jgi:hypothetical protein
MRQHRLRAVVVAAFVVVAALVVPASATTNTSPYVRVCGKQLCLHDATFPWQAASSLTGPSDPTGAAGMAVSAKLNVLRVVDFLDVAGATKTAPYDATRWARVDGLIAAAARAGLKVELDLSTYRNLLVRHGINPYTYDWGPFVRWVAARKNTVTKQIYANDPTIAMIAFAGEVEPPAGSNNTLKVTTAQVTSFFSRTLGQWRAKDSHHLLTPGGLLQIDWNSGIDWRAIFSLPVVNVCAIHIYGLGDQATTVPAVSSYCGGLNKPWITEEFGYAQADTDPVRAAEFTHIYDLQSTYGSAGAGFWNLGPQTTGTTYDVNTQTPVTWSVVQSHAPVPKAVP